MPIEMVSPLEQSNLKFRVVKHVTRPLLKMEDGQDYYIKFEAKMFQAEALKNAPASDKKAPPYIAHVVDLETGHASQIICNEVLRTEIDKSFPNDTYVGKAFHIIRNKIAENKKYATFNITEIALVEEPTTQAPAAQGSVTKTVAPAPVAVAGGKR